MKTIQFQGHAIGHVGKIASIAKTRLATSVFVVILGFGSSFSVATAAESDAKQLLKAMSDYMMAQNNVSFKYDTSLDIVTTDKQKLALTSSGTVKLNRPNKIRITRNGGFSNAEFIFDGKTMTLFGKNENVYAQLSEPGTVDHLVDVLRDKHGVPMPGADLLMSNIYTELMASVTNTKDLGSGVIGGVECDHLAFRTKEVDWEIWIAQGAKPYPCRYVITSNKVSQAPQYSVTIMDWKNGDKADARDFTFNNKTNAKKVELSKLPNLDELPKQLSGAKK